MRTLKLPVYENVVFNTLEELQGRDSF